MKKRVLSLLLAGVLAAGMLPVTASAAQLTFSDVPADHWASAAIADMTERGMFSGTTEPVDGVGTFAPDATMTRSEFAAIVVRALGLTPKTTDIFTDVSADAWYAGYVGTAYTYGIINGVGDGRFLPNGTISRQEAAVMVARAAKLCGMDTALEDYQILNTLAQFTDYVTIAPWARAGLAFCYGEDILDQSDLNVEPIRAILRGEIAEMLCNLLDSAKLL